MLKPDGWIQWHETDGTNLQVYSNVPGASREHATRFLETMQTSQKKYGKIGDEVLRLKQIVSGAGFVDCAEDLVSSDRVAHMRHAGNQSILGAALGICKKTMVAEPQLGWTAQQIDELHLRAQEEMKDVKAYYRWNMHVVTAKKPLQ